MDESDRPITGPPFSKTDGVSFERLRVNHYVTKSEEEFRRKQARGASTTAGRMRDRFRRRSWPGCAPYDEVEDRTIQMYLPALREELARVEPQAAARPRRSLGGRRPRGSCRRP